MIGSVDAKKIKVAIVHDFLTQYGGAERCLEVFKEIFPDAPVFTLLYNEKKLSKFHTWDIKTSSLQKLPFWRKSHYFYFPFYHSAIEKFDLSDYDIVLSSSVNYANGIGANGALHICYCYCIPRFAYLAKDKYLKNYNPIIRYVTNLFIERFKAWDTKAKSKPDCFIVDSKNIQSRLQERYGIDSEVIYPPVDMTFFKPAGTIVQGEYFLVVSRMKEYKNIELAIEACQKLHIRLKIIGTGNHLLRLQYSAGPNIEFLGFVSDKDLREYYRGCKGLIVPAEEDFGIVALEAQACGKPVIAVKKGGVLETVEDGKTGIFFADETVESLAEALIRFTRMQFNSEKIRANVLKFEKQIFKEKIRAFIFSKYSEFFTAKGSFFVIRKRLLSLMIFSAAVNTFF